MTSSLLSRGFGRAALVVAAPALVLGGCGIVGDDAPTSAVESDVRSLQREIDALRSDLDAMADLEQRVATIEDDAGHDTVPDQLAMAAPVTDHDAPPHWGYADADHWAELTEEFATCGSGTAQSPIDLTAPSIVDLDDLSITYRPGSATVTDNGHTVEVSTTGAGAVSIDGRRFKLVQFHFHAPSEHTVDGVHAPVELHLVHADADGDLAVIGVMIVEGDDAPAVDPVLAAVPDEVGVERTLRDPLDAAALLPEHVIAYRYEGSLTTPPCTEGVMWHVLEQPVTWSADQIATLTGHLAEPNNRPVQPLNGRLLESDVAAG